MSKPLFTDAEWTFPIIEATTREIEIIGRDEMGIDYYPPQLQMITSEQMLDCYSSVGLPVYYNHWSFGKHFARDQKDYKSGASGLAYEIVINSSPCIAYLMEENSMTTQALVIAHASVGHSAFFKNNYLFKTWTDAESIVDYMVFAKDYVAKCEAREGQEEVERFLDSCHALMDYGVNRYKRPSKISMVKEQQRQREREEYLQSRVDEMYRILPTAVDKVVTTEDDGVLESPEENILYFCEKNSPFLKPWQRELIRIVRKVAQYFYPQGQTKVGNEGFASWTHYTIMNRLHAKGLITDGSQLEWLGLHTNVLTQRPMTHLNPYKLGFEILRDIERICADPTDEDRKWFPQLIGANALDAIKDIVANYRDESMLRQFLSPTVMRKMRLFHVYDDREMDDYIVNNIHNEQGYQNIREALAESHEREAHVPKIEVVKVSPKERELTLAWTPYKGRVLDDPELVLRHVERLWGNRVILRDNEGTLLDHT